ncbi:chaplin [Streptomyces sp. XD-27]|uniref:chaplin n=1 Tax=Streptomyces sp. XD-27 TaxID=3062779 RepID=UPI0026F42051|nr:chaplin [Streptomyces sp. XD-27]WKX72685.1 chaplin [Streptomyces sp. XD-27]
MLARTAVAAAALASAATLAGAGTALAHGGAHADGKATNSPGIVSGNVIQVPVHVPVNACGNTISVVGLLNPTFGNYCVNK